MRWLTPTMALAVGTGWDRVCGAAAARSYRTACGAAANSGELIHGAASACWRHKLWLHQEAFEGGGAVTDNNVGFCYY